MSASRLVVGCAFCYVDNVMNRWSSRRLFALLLGVFLALGMSLSAVQASDMAVKMAMASDTGGAGQGSCDACGGGDDGSTSQGNCMPICTASGPALVPSGFVATAAALTDPPAPRPHLNYGRISPPDPYPPRPSDPA